MSLLKEPNQNPWYQYQINYGLPKSTKKEYIEDSEPLLDIFSPLDI